MPEYAAKRGGTIASQIKEISSGVSERELRHRLLDAARRRDICPEVQALVDYLAKRANDGELTRNEDAE